VKKSIKKHLRNLNPSRIINFQNDIVKTKGTHQKILICDRAFAITGSFNWLSYKGQKGQGYRRELGVVFRHPDPVNELAEIAMKTWNSTK
jgi:phosphatidylserine/phosphatidylglycerophosphate/cardiolipin synthase-like enzyme